MKMIVGHELPRSSALIKGRVHVIVAAWLQPAGLADNMTLIFHRLLLSVLQIKLNLTREGGEAPSFASLASHHPLPQEQPTSSYTHKIFFCGGVLHCLIFL